MQNLKNIQVNPQFSAKEAIKQSIWKKVSSSCLLPKFLDFVRQTSLSLPLMQSLFALMYALKFGFWLLVLDFLEE
ncbi:hypothetical protein T12_4790 [Trichinella patagoniensis]|uniref:Uncharacterized protein n=1 Tax=Trichinella patagoniensis TaxID=990121 RepID=A0A0V0ZR46_9BILA|nr:hypothetical protein T12_4790 [Trichinella patagoniensis]